MFMNILKFLRFFIAAHDFVAIARTIVPGLESFINNFLKRFMTEEGQFKVKGPVLNFIFDLIAPFYKPQNHHLQNVAENFFFYVCKKPSFMYLYYFLVQVFYLLSFFYIVLICILLTSLFFKIKILLEPALMVRAAAFQPFHFYLLYFIFLISALSKRFILATMTHFSFYVYLFWSLNASMPNPFTILMLLPLVFLFVVLFVRTTTLHLNLEIYFLYIKFMLINFFLAYSFQLTILFFAFHALSCTFLKKHVLSFAGTYKFLVIKNHLMLKAYFNFSKIFLFKFIFIIDDLGLIFMWLSYLLVCLCIYFLWSTMRNDKNFTLYISQLILLLLQLQLTFTAIDIFTFFLAFESLLIPMIIMIALWGSKNNRQANNYLIFYTMVSAIPMLLAILYLKAYGFDTTIFGLQKALHALSLSEKMVIWLSFFFAFAVKTPMVPVHIWLPKTHVDAPTVGSVILAGVLLKVGLIGILRFLFPVFPVLSHFFAPYVTAIATIGVIYASLITLRQIDAKRIIAYSSVAHMNMAMVSLFSFNVVGLYSTVYLMVSHGLIASGLFFLVGFLYNRFHVRSIYYYSGLATCMPVAAIYFFLFTLANMAFPLTSGFIGEFLLLLGITLNNFYLGVLNSLSMLLTTVYSVLLFGRIFLGELKIWLEQMVLNYIRLQIYNQANNNGNVQEQTQLDLYAYERVILNVLFFYIIILGVYPQYLFSIFNTVGSFFYILLPIL